MNMTQPYVHLPNEDLAGHDRAAINELLQRGIKEQATQPKPKFAYYGEEAVQSWIYTDLNSFISEVIYWHDRRIATEQTGLWACWLVTDLLQQCHNELGIPCAWMHAEARRVREIWKPFETFSDEQCQ